MYANDLKKVLKQNFVLFFLGYDHYLLGRKILIITQQLKGETYEWFIKLGIRPTSTLGPIRDQLINIQSARNSTKFHVVERYVLELQCNQALYASIGKLN
jgi:hypothetical protein